MGSGGRRPKEAVQATPHFPSNRISSASKIDRFMRSLSKDPFPLVPKLRLGTHWLRQLHCRA
jgi:hypothetical protein